MYLVCKIGGSIVWKKKDGIFPGGANINALHEAMQAAGAQGIIMSHEAHRDWSQRWGRDFNSLAAFTDSYVEG